MQQRTSVVALEVGVVEHDRPASMLDSTAHDDPVALGEALLDVAPPEPDRLGLAAVVLEDGRRALDSPAEGLLHTQLSNAHPGAGHLALLDRP